MNPEYVKHETMTSRRFARRRSVSVTLLLVLELGAQFAFAQTPSRSATLPRTRFRSGEETLQAFAPVSAATRFSIVKFNVDGQTVALGTVVATNGLTLTKASEIKQGRLTCWLASDKEVSAELLARDDEEDLALVRVNAKGLKPIEWTMEPVSIGEWGITPGIATTPQAVGIVSALPRRIRPTRAFIGVRFDVSSSVPKIEELLPGLGAAKAGLKSGDIIVSLNQAAVTNREQVVEMIRDFREGQTIQLGVQRAEARLDTEVQLMSPKAVRSGSSPNPDRRLARLQGEVSQRSEGFEQVIEHDTVLQPWLCGGPLVSLDGKALGINIARAGRVTTYALPAKLVKRLLQNLESAPQQPLESSQ